MRAIRSKNTKPELLVRKALHAARFRFRLHVSVLSGAPDIVLPRYQTVIFVQDCFWHGHNCKCFKLPKTRPEFWLSKIEANRARNVINIEKLNLKGWHVIQVWECAIRSGGLGLPEIINSVADFLSGHETRSEFTVITV